MTVDIETARRLRAELAHELRNPPEDRDPWNFSVLCQCALHDANRLNIDVDKDLALSRSDVIDIFGIAHDSKYLYGRPMSEVTPEMVAAALEAAPYHLTTTDDV